MEKFTICVIYTAKEPGDAMTFVNEMIDSGIVNMIRAENGCNKYEYFHDCENEKRIVLFEEWESKEHQQIHMTQPHMKLAMQIKSKYIDSVELKELKLN